MIKNLTMFKVKYNPIQRAYSMIVVAEENKSSFLVTTAAVKNDSQFLKQFFEKLELNYHGNEDTTLLTNAIRQGAEFEGRISGNKATIQLIDGLYDEDSFEKEYTFKNLGNAILNSIFDIKNFIKENEFSPKLQEQSGKDEQTSHHEEHTL